MHPTLPNFVRRHQRQLLTTLGAIAIAAVTALAQISSFEGELWGAQTLPLPGGAWGIAFSNSELFVVDDWNGTVIAFDGAGQVVAKPGAQWNNANMPGWAPSHIVGAVFNHNSTTRPGVLISDWQSNRLAAFDNAGQFLFTLRIGPSTDVPYQARIDTMAFSTGARFNFTTTGPTPTLSLTGSFAAGWTEWQISGEYTAGALAFNATDTFSREASGEFVGATSKVLTGLELNPTAPIPVNIFGVAFDKLGNLYMMDSYTERLNVYNPTFTTRLFTYGTPTPGDKTAEFDGPNGIAFWPDTAAESNGRLFVNDLGRIQVFRPVDSNDDDVIDGLELESEIKNFIDDPWPFALALDTTNDLIAMTDWNVTRAVLLRKGNLATVNVQFLDTTDAVIESVCTGAEYKVQFSLTVPAGMDSVNLVVPTLVVNGVPVLLPSSGPAFPLTVAAGEVVTFTYNLTAPSLATGDIEVLAGATASTTNIVLRAAGISLSSCAGETDPSTITATPTANGTPRPAQVSGWTPVFQGENYSITLDAQDDDGIDSFQYELDGANDTAGNRITIPVLGEPTTATGSVPITVFGRTTVKYRVRDGNMIWSGWHTLDVRPKRVLNRSSNENNTFEFKIGDPEGPVTFSVSGLPTMTETNNQVPLWDGTATFSTATSQFGGVVSFAANNRYSADTMVASGVYNVVVTETHNISGETSSVSFVWTINNINRPPVITNAPVNPAPNQQGDLFQLQINGSDPDGDPSVFTINGFGANTGHVMPAEITIDPVSGLISGIFPPDSDTAYNFRVGLAECSTWTPTPPCNVDLPPGDRTATFYDFTLQVADSNEPAEILNPGPQTNAEGDVINLQIAASDPEGDLLTFDASGLPGGLSITRLDAQTALISGTIGWDTAGTYGVTITADDQINEARSESFTWVVTATNRPPTFTPPDRTSLEGNSAVGSPALSATDPEHGTLTYGATGLPPGVLMDSHGVFTGSFDYDNTHVNRTFTVNVTVNDGTNNVSASFVWTVLDHNRPPTLTAPNRTNVAGDAVDFTFSATDPEHDALSYSINGMPDNMTLEAATGRVTGTLRLDSARTYTVNVAVFDGTVNDSKSFLWIVREPNHPPVVTNPGTQTSVESNSVVTLSIAASDPDGQTLTYSMTGLPAGFSINSAGVISGTFGFDAAPSYTVTVTANDGDATDPRSDSETFVWNVTNVNRAPSASPDTAVVIQGQSVTINVLTNDSDADGTATLVITGVSGVTNGSVSIAPDGKTLTFTAAPTYVGPVTFNYTIEDGAHAAAGSTVTVTVNPSNVAPVCTAATVSSGSLWPPNHRQVYISIAGITDADGGTPTVTFTSILQDEPTNSVGDGNTTQDAGIESGGAVAWVRAERTGTVDGRVYIVNFTATDGQASCSGTVMIDGVPHDQGQGSTPNPSPGRWNSITGALVVPPPPDAINDAYSVVKSASQVLSVLSNDVVYGSPVVTIVSGPSAGTATVNPTGTITYTAPATTGTATFTYRVTNAGGTDTAVATITIKKK